MGRATQTTGIYNMFAKKNIEMYVYFLNLDEPQDLANKQQFGPSQKSGLTAKLRLCSSVTLSYFVSPAMSELQLVLMQTRPTYPAFQSNT